MRRHGVLTAVLTCGVTEPGTHFASNRRLRPAVIACWRQTGALTCCCCNFAAFHRYSMSPGAHRLSVTCCAR